MGEYNIEKQIRAKLENHPTKLDKELLWDKIQVKQKSFFWKKLGLFSVGAAGLLFISSLLFSSMNKKQTDLISDSGNNVETIDNNKTTEILKNIDSDQSLNSKKTNLIDSDPSLVSNNNELQNNTTNFNTLDNTAKESNKKQDDLIASSSQYYSQNTNTSSKTYTAQSENKPNSTQTTYTNTSATSGKRTSQSLKETKAKLALEDSKSNRNSDSNNNSGTNENTQSVFSKAQATQDQTKGESISLMKSASKKQLEKSGYGLLANYGALNTIEKISFLDSDSERQYSKSLPELEDCFIYNKKSVECYDPNRKRNSIFIETYALIDYVHQSLNAPADELNYLERRDTTTSYQLSDRIGIQVKYLFRNGLFIKSGIERAMMRENFYERTVETKTTIEPNQLIDIDVDMNGNTTETYGNAPVTTVTTTTWDVNNTFKTFDVPFLLGYQTKRGPFRYSFEAGVSYNIKSNFSGWLLDSNNRPTTAANGTPTSFFKENSNLSILGGLNVLYSINSRWNLVAKANYKQGLERLNSDITNVIAEKRTQIGIGIGAEYKLSKGK